MAGAAWMRAGTPWMVFVFTVTEGRITGIGMIADPDAIATLDVVPG